MAAAARAFLSYTRIDDEFFGGAITALRKLLELGVQVVTGERDFSIFQDIEGIELGQRWQERLDEAVEEATFLIPIMTPSFFKSAACHDELKKFLAHERSLNRNDLILPIYYVTAPILERAELLKEDPVAQEISKRQRFDWREQADLAATDPIIRTSVRKLAAAIAPAMARVEASPKLTVTEETKRSKAFSVATTQVVEEQEKQRNKVRPSILWVDDRPDNNTVERKALSEYNVDIHIARSTDEAIDAIQDREFNLIISDMGRPPDAKAGYTLLKALRSGGNKTPFYIYAGSRAPEHTKEAIRRGAQGNTNRADELIQMVLTRLGTSASTAEL